MLVSDLLKTYKTEDYQNRDGSYPKSDIPVSLNVYESNHYVFIEASFKNTNESIGKKWMENFLKNKFQNKYDSIYIELDSWQEGDYQNDWIGVQAKIVDKKI